MADTVKITATVGAYLRSEENRPDFVMALREPECYARLMGSVLCFSDFDMSRTWARIGTAEITVTVMAEDAQVAEAVKTLKSQIEEARAKFLQFQADALEKISKLSALTYEAEKA